MLARSNRRVLLLLLLASSAPAQTTERASVDSAGAEADFNSAEPSLSADGRFVAFRSSASNLVAGDSNATWDIFVHDRLAGTTERVSVDSAGAQANSSSWTPSISADGRFVAFSSLATNLVPGDTNGRSDIFVRDRLAGTTERVSLGAAGTEADSDSYAPALSADGRLVAFQSLASNLVAGDTGWFDDVFVRDRLLGTTERVSVDSAGAQADNYSYAPSLSADGRFVAFASRADNLVLTDNNLYDDVFVHDRQGGTTERVSVATGGTEGDGASESPSLSANGRFVAFQSLATNFGAGDTNGFRDVFVRDLQSGTTEPASLDSVGILGNSASDTPALSADGRWVAFRSFSTNLVPSDANGVWDVFVHDRQGGATERASIDSNGAEGNGESGTFRIAISRDGRFSSFESWASNLVPNDTNWMGDIFVRDRGPLVPGMDLCQPGASGVIACPCSNPPANAPRGCDNSSGTGGAQLVSSGTASLTFDSVVFTTNGEKPSATSIVLQGNAAVANGAVFGQGVRCVGGGLKRLYVKTAVGGAISAPGPGDPSVSDRSAALGAILGPGTNCWYAVFYRDPLVLGGCAPSSTYNTTQAQVVTWNS